MLLFPLLLLFLPFFSLFPHPTWLLAGFSVLIMTVWLCQGGYKRRYSSTDALVLLFSIANLLGGIKADMLQGALQAFLILLYFPASTFLENENTMKKGRTGIIFSSFLVSLWGIAQYLFGCAPLEWVDTDRFGNIGGRVTAVFQNPNVLAVYLLLVMPFALERAFDSSLGLGQRLFYFLTRSFSMVCILLTWSRGAWLGAIAEILLFLLLYSSKSRRLLLLGIPVVLLAVPMLPQNVIGRFSSIGSLTESSIRYRLYVWRGTLRMIAAHPFGIGIGENAFSTHYISYALSGTESVMHTHHILLQILCETGWIGLLLFFLLFFMIIRQFAGQIKQGEGRGSIAPACALCSCLIMGLFDHIWYHFGNMALFWIIMAMTKNRKEVTKREE